MTYPAIEYDEEQRRELAHDADAQDRERFAEVPTPEPRHFITIACPVCNVAPLVVSAARPVLMSEGAAIHDVLRVENRVCGCLGWIRDHKWAPALDDYRNRIHWRAEDRWASAELYRRDTGEWPEGVEVHHA